MANTLLVLASCYMGCKGEKTVMKVVTYRMSDNTSCCAIWQQQQGGRHGVYFGLLHRELRAAGV